MKNIEIKDLKLMNLHVAVTQQDVVYIPENVQAILQVQYNFHEEEKKIISYRIVVGEDPEHSLFHVKCDYQFTVDKNNHSDQSIVQAAMDMLQPRVEEILALITMEAGYIQVEPLKN